MSLMSKQCLVMERITYADGDVDPLVIFAADTDGEMSPEKAVSQRSVSLHRQDWEDMGSPDVVTVSIQPGDHLNGEI